MNNHERMLEKFISENEGNYELFCLYALKDYEAYEDINQLSLFTIDDILKMNYEQKKCG